MKLPSDLLSRIVTLLVLADIVWLVDWTTRTLFSHADTITGTAAAAYATLVGVLPIYVGFYEWARRRNGRHDPQ